MEPRTVLLWTLAILAALFSLISVVITALDKSRARDHGKRISESTLLYLAALGGAPLMFITMLLIHHKTRHIKFMLGLPLMIAYQALIVYLILT